MPAGGRLDGNTPGEEEGRERERQAVTKDLTSSSKFSGSCVLTLQPLPRMIRGYTVNLPLPLLSYLLVVPEEVIDG